MEVKLVIIGIVLIVVAIVGGKVSLGGAKFPKVIFQARVMLAIFGIGSVLFGFFVVEFKNYILHQIIRSSSCDAREEHGEVNEIIHSNSQPTLSRHGIKISDLKVIGERDSWRVHDCVFFNFSFQNTTKSSIPLDQVFVAARGPDATKRADDDYIFGSYYSETVLTPGEVINVKTNPTSLEESGNWIFWPCYKITGGQFCGDSLAKVSILVQK